MLCESVAFFLPTMISGGSRAADGSRWPIACRGCCNGCEVAFSVCDAALVAEHKKSCKLEEKEGLHDGSVTSREENGWTRRRRGRDKEG